MSGSGRWSQQIVFKNCSNKACLQGCALNSSAKPHGPYAILRRRNPESGDQEHVYLGKAPLTAEQLGIVNSKYIGPLKPTKEEVRKATGFTATEDEKRPTN